MIDIYITFLNRKISQRKQQLLGRLSVVVIAIVAVLLALNPKSSILQLVAYAWSGLGASFGPVILISLYWKRMTRRAAVCGMLVGMLTTIIWHILGKHLGGIFLLYNMIPAFLLNCVAIALVSLLDQPPLPEIVNEYQDVVSI